MYDPNGYELWRERREDLLREVQKQRLIRRLRTARQKDQAWFHRLIGATSKAGRLADSLVGEARQRG